jgi:hypothetical protein
MQSYKIEAVGIISRQKQEGEKATTVDGRWLYLG